jgi:hypothetical protein
MLQVEVVLKALAITSRYGALKSGDRLTTDPEFAKHLVEDCQAAEYVKPTAAIEAASSLPEPKATKARKK